MLGNIWLYKIFQWEKKQAVGFIFLACSFSTCSILGLEYALGAKGLTCAAQGTI